MPHRLYHLVADRAAHRCEYCLAPEMSSNVQFEVEHIRPRHLGGSDDESNLALACRACNASKYTAISGRDPATGLLTRLFHPRTDDWDDHFVIDEQFGEGLGLTDVGRATVARLSMNDTQQRLARRFWIVTLRFPAEPVNHPDDATSSPRAADDEVSS